MIHPLKNFIRSTIAPLIWGLMLMYCGIIVWLGALTMFGYGVAPVLFRLIPSRDLAGLVNTEILSRLQTLEHLALMFIIAGVSLYSYHARVFLRSRFLALSLVLILCLTGMLFWYAHGITPSMIEIRQNITSFDRPTIMDEPLLKDFRALHQLYSRLVGVQMFILLLVFFWQTALFIHVLFQVNSPQKPEYLEIISS